MPRRRSKCNNSKITEPSRDGLGTILIDTRQRPSATTPVQLGGSIAELPQEQRFKETCQEELLPPGVLKGREGP